MEDSKEEVKEKNVHAGHRQRLKDKVRQNGLKVLSKHEALELLLTYTIPQKDTNKLAHNLLLEYGNFANILDAGYEDLKKMKGVGDETALFLSTLPSYVEMYKSCKLKSQALPINTTQDCIDYFRNNFEIRTREYLYFVMLNKLNHVIRTFVVEGNDDCSISLDMPYITSKLTSNNTYAIAIFHTHPSGSVYPSNDDILTTQSILNLCCMLQIKFYDHLIFNETQCYSFNKNGLLTKMLNYLQTVFPNLSTKTILLQQKACMEFKDKDKK